MPETKKKVAKLPSKPPANEFFRGDEATFNGGGMTIVSPVASIFNPGPVSTGNCMEREIAKQAPKGKRVIR